jgi:hypothetical protein
MGMPAKVGPKRVRALAQAGCYFDGTAARCGENCSSREERGGCKRAIAIVAHMRISALRLSTHCEQSETSIPSCADAWIASLRSQ